MIQKYYIDLHSAPMLVPADDGDLCYSADAEHQLARLREQNEKLQAENAGLREDLDCPSPINGKTTKADCIAAGQCGCNAQACATRQVVEKSDQMVAAYLSGRKLPPTLFERMIDLRSAIDAARGAK